MAYNLDHWNNPRGSIANKYVNNDFAYVSRGANIALYVLQQFDIKPSEAKEMTVLDYGCGTGRAAAFMALLFKQSVGYDPNKYCIREARAENEKSELRLSNLILTDRISDIPECDIAFSTNVIEHLNEHDASVMVNVLKIKVKGKTLLWYAPERNGVLQPYADQESWGSKLKGGKIQIDFFDIH